MFTFIIIIHYLCKSSSEKYLFYCIKKGTTSVFYFFDFTKIDMEYYCLIIFVILISNTRNLISHRKNCILISLTCHLKKLFCHTLQYCKNDDLSEIFKIYSCFTFKKILKKVTY